MVLRKSLFAALSIASLVGCSAGAGSRLAIRPDSAPQTPPSMRVAEVVETLNRNAEKVEGLTASTTVSVNDSHFVGGTSGRLALERPRNFKLNLEKGFGGSVVDVGSNDQEFWFWTKNSKDKSIYVGQYGANGAAPPELLVQPDWIVEALGLHVIPEEEIRRLKVERGRDRTLVLTHFRDDGRGGTALKKTVLNEQGQILRHYFYASDSKRPVAVATPSNYRALKVAGESTDASADTLELPQKVHLALYNEQNSKDPLVMDIALSNVEINPRFTEENRQALFSVPKIAGYQVKRINESPSYAEGPSRLYESRSIPPIQAGTELGEPTPFGTEGASLKWSDPMPLSADLAAPPEPEGAEALVAPGIPRPPGTPPSSTSPGATEPQPVRRASLGYGFSQY